MLYCLLKVLQKYLIFKSKVLRRRLSSTIRSNEQSPGEQHQIAEMGHIGYTLGTHLHTISGVRLNVYLKSYYICFQVHNCVSYGSHLIYLIVYKVYELLYKIDIILNDINAQFPEFETIKSAFKLFYSVDGWVQLMVFRFILFICDLNIDNKIKRFSKYQFKV